MRRFGSPSSAPERLVARSPFNWPVSASTMSPSSPGRTRSGFDSCNVTAGSSTSRARATVRVIDTLDEETAYDLLIVTLLDHQTAAILPDLQRSAAKRIQFMFNTFHPEYLQEAVGAARCAFGMAFVQATLDSDGKLKSTIGAGGQKTIMCDQRWVDMFNAAGLPANRGPDMPLWLRCHVPLCIAFESVAVAAKRRGGGASWGEAMILARGVHESFNLLKGLDYPIYPRAKKLINSSHVAVLAASLWSMSRISSFREVLATGKAECQVLVDVMVAAVPMSKRRVNVSAIRAMKPI